MNLSQMAFAGLMGVIPNPTGAAQVLLNIAANYPEVFRKLKKISKRLIADERREK